MCCQGEAKLTLETLRMGSNTKTNTCDLNGLLFCFFCLQQANEAVTAAASAADFPPVNWVC